MYSEPCSTMYAILESDPLNNNSGAWNALINMIFGAKIFSALNRLIVRLKSPLSSREGFIKTGGLVGDSLADPWDTAFAKFNSGRKINES